MISDTKALSYAWNDDTLRLWDLRSGECLNIFKGNVNGAYFLPDNHSILSWSLTDSFPHLWDLKSGKSKKFEDGYASLEGVFQISDEHVLSWSSDEVLRIWSLQSGELEHEYEGHQGVFDVVELLSGEKILFLCQQKGKGLKFSVSLRLWDRANDNIKNITNLSDERLFYLSYRLNFRYGWKKLFLAKKNSIAAIREEELVCWFGSEPSLEEFSKTGTWLVIDELTQVQALHPWRGNKPS